MPPIRGHFGIYKDPFGERDYSRLIAPEVREFKLRRGDRVSLNSSYTGTQTSRPIGSIEQHGYHLLVSTDTILVDEVTNLGADRVADEVPVLTLSPI